MILQQAQRDEPVEIEAGAHTDVFEHAPLDADGESADCGLTGDPIGENGRYGRAEQVTGERSPKQKHVEAAKLRGLVEQLMRVEDQSAAERRGEVANRPQDGPSVFGAVGGEEKNGVDWSHSQDLAAFEAIADGAIPYEFRWRAVGEIVRTERPMQIDHLQIVRTDELVFVTTGERARNVIGIKSGADSDFRRSAPGRQGPHPEGGPAGRDR